MLQRMAWSSVPSPSFSAARLGEIVAPARIDNQRNHVSGMLVFTGAHFVEIVEGEARELDALWSRVQSDDRHHGLLRHGCEPCGDRWFADWKMGYADEDDVGAELQALRAPGRAHGSTWAKATHAITLRADSM
jgi:hypothetical protein